ncbi:MAG: ATP-binding protein [Deltaproteobacteria bacterium]|nr:ATP-binding protein [Deltaproteobacteria bacterium]
MTPKELPLGDPTFREIIQGNYLYADKTEYINSMLKGPKFLFLSRPRRFGKTLLLDTVEELFLGNRELFKGLRIDAESGYSFERHPILRFDMSYAEIHTREDLVFKIKRDLARAAKSEDVKISSDSFDDMLEELLESLFQKYGIGTAVLVDEYDDPVSSLLSNRKLAVDNLGVLRGFYKSLKKFKKHIRFALVTGVTRYAMSALGSGPNNFLDISLMPEYSEVCGFTAQELDDLFGDRFEEALVSLKANGDIDPGIDMDVGLKALKEKILEWYDGYNWLGDARVLNPYSIINFFKKRELDDYWPSSGQPSHLSAFVRKRPLEFIQPSLDGYPAEQIGKIDLRRRLAAVPVLFHSGYLTIDRITRKTRIINGNTVKIKEFTFRTPNLEVALNYRASFFKAAFELDDRDFNDFAENLPKALSERDAAETARLLGDLFAGIASVRHKSSEKFFHAVLQAAFLAAGIEVLSEVRAGLGRSDMVVFLKDGSRVVIELKYRKAEETDDGGDDTGFSEKDFVAALDAAEKQIRDRDYSGAHRLAVKEVICLALTVRGKYEVAARYLDPEDTGGPQAP